MPIDRCKIFTSKCLKNYNHSTLLLLHSATSTTILGIIIFVPLWKQFHIDIFFTFTTRTKKIILLIIFFYLFLYLYPCAISSYLFTFTDEAQRASWLRTATPKKEKTLKKSFQRNKGTVEHFCQVGTGKHI